MARKGLGTVYKDSDPRRKARFVAEKTVRLPDGRRKRVRARAERESEAIDLLERKIRAEIAAAPAGKSLTLEAFLRLWLAHKKPTVRASTLHDYTRDVERYVSPDLGPIPLSKVNARMIQALLSDILARGHVTTADKVRRLLRQAFGWALRMEYVNENPMLRIEPIRKGRPNRGAWTPQQLVAFLRAAKGSAYFPIFYAAVSTGMRKGELLALEWRDIQDGMILVRRTVSRAAKDGVAEPKTPDGYRRVPLSADLAAVLAKARKGSDLVFPSRTGHRISGTNLTRALRRIAVAAGVPVIRFHDLRRTSASLLARANVPPSAIQARLGHSTPTLAMQVYTDVYEEDARRAVVDLGLLSGGNSGGVASKRHHTLLGVWHRSPRAGLRVGRVLSRRARRLVRRLAGNS